MTTVGSPPAPSRTRLIRPGFYRAEATGSLAPDVRDMLVGLTTMADDEGWLVWHPAEIAASLYPYAPAGRRLRDLERRAGRLVEAELLVIKECGCALLPTLKEHHAVKGGVKLTAIWAWHHTHSVALHSATETSVSDSVSGSSSSSGSLSDSGSSSSRATNGAALSEAAPSSALSTCEGCGQATNDHSLRCPQAPWMAVAR